MIDILNEMAARDPKAIYTLLNSKVPCNNNLSSYKYAVTQPVDNGHFLSLLGVLNGIRLEQGLPQIRARWETWKTSGELISVYFEEMEE